MNVLQLKYEYINHNINVIKELITEAVIKGLIQNKSIIERDAKKFGYDDDYYYMSGIVSSSRLMAEVMMQNALFELTLVDGVADPNETEIFQCLFEKSDGFIFKFLNVNDWIKYYKKGTLQLIKKEVKLIEKNFTSGMYRSFAINIGKKGDVFYDMIINCCKLALHEFSTVDGVVTTAELAYIDSIAEKYFTAYDI